MFGYSQEFNQESIWTTTIMPVILFVMSYRRQSRYDQIILEEERSLIQKWDEEKRMQKMAERGMLLQSRRSMAAQN